ncbi:cation-translocating P-type ATPase [Eubacterium barkeri]|uniref:Ca2+-transporting ATPase n=1 Tax=Eubacterium barkeri TaxID=1528 RepID=A0A1H3JRW6_EUBBA|nr:cation-translocating P-type ATPase [Eubacterium barkeri]SDY42683.1 Ca2+-transporting ATPase [Eubacterium barkeri]
MNDLQKIQGLTTAEATAQQAKWGKNELVPQKKQNFFLKVLHIIAEPMFLLLLAAAIIYFILGEPRDGAIMLIFVIGIITIDVIQEWKTDKTLTALRDLSAPHVSVIRDGVERSIPSVDLVPGDIMLLSEGIKIPADGTILKCNDFCVDESSLTGESMGVWKVPEDAAPKLGPGEYWRTDYCYGGTLVTQGTAMVRVDQIGARTEYGKIGAGVASAPQEDTPLQKQTGRLVKLCAGIAGVLFALVGILNFINLAELPLHSRIIESILSGITLAMAMIPEEFPVILTVFLSMGAWRLAKNNALVRRLPSVETLGAVSVLCVDKTGTITQNRMTVTEAWAQDGDAQKLIRTMGMGCETDAYDPMEKAMLRYCEEHGFTPGDLFDGTLVTEYPFTNETKMMGHVWQRPEGILLAAKGSPERLLPLCHLSEEARIQVEAQLDAFSRQGLRVIAVAQADYPSADAVPTELSDNRLTFLGLIGLSDPPRPTVAADIARCNAAGIRVVMITGDNGITASAIAKTIGMPHADNIITGDMLETMDDAALREAIKTTNIFSRVIPEHKMRIVRAFKENGQIVAMTGDGVNDASALKYADIGIAMGKRGSEVSREAADLILMDDDFSTIVDTVKDGRRIFDNIRRAVGYVFTIHIPIAFSALLGPLLGISPGALLLLPLHVVLLELVIDPTCSIVLEREPAEQDIMERPPRNPEEPLLDRRTLTKSIIQGLCIFAASFGTYFAVLAGNPANAPMGRAMALTIIIVANLLLVFVNCSDHDSILTAMGRLVKDKVMWAVGLGTVAILLLILYSPLNQLLKLAALTPGQFFFSLGLGVACVIWYEVVKTVRRSRQHQ